MESSLTVLEENLFKCIENVLSGWKEHEKNIHVWGKATMSGPRLKHKDLSSSNCKDIIGLFLYTHIYFN